MRQVTAYIHHFMTEKVTDALRMANMGLVKYTCSFALFGGLRWTSWWS